MPETHTHETKRRRTRPRLHEVAPPRMVTQGELAWHFGLSVTAFAEKLPALEAEGFPRPDPLLNRYDLRAVDAWMDQRSFAESNYDGTDERLEAFRNGKTRSETP